MIRIVRAEAIVEYDGECPPEAMGTAKAAGILAGRRSGELIPTSPEGIASKIAIAIEAGDGTIRITASAEAESPAPALIAASIAAITLAEAIGATLRAVTPVDAVPAPKKASWSERRGQIARRSQPTTLMGLVSAPPPREGASDARAALRNFMAAHHLRATDWAKTAKVPPAELYAFLTGRSRALPKETAEKLAQAAKVRVEDMFR